MSSNVMFIYHIDSSKTYKIPINKDISILRLKRIILYKINRDIDKKNKLRNLKLKYITKVLENKKQIKDYNIPNNTTIFVSTSKLKGGDIGLTYGLIIVPNTALFINLVLLVIWCPIQYFLLMYGATKERVLDMMYSGSFFAIVNNYNLRLTFDDRFKKSLKRGKFINFKYNVLKSKLYMIYSLFYFIFVTFFANLWPLNTFLSTYGKFPFQPENTRTSKCFLANAAPQVFNIGVIILFVVPFIIYFLNYFGFQFGLFSYIITLIVSSAAIITSVYNKAYQNYDDANALWNEGYTDPSITKVPTYNQNEIKYMPNYFGALYVTPIICAIVILFCFFILDFKHSIVWGLICAFAAPIPLYFVMGPSLPLYCIQHPFLKRSATDLDNAIKNNGKEYTNLKDFRTDVKDPYPYKIDNVKHTLCYKLNPAPHSNEACIHIKGN